MARSNQAYENETFLDIYFKVCDTKRSTEVALMSRGRRGGPGVETEDRLIKLFELSPQDDSLS